MRAKRLGSLSLPLVVTLATLGFTPTLFADSFISVPPPGGANEAFVTGLSGSDPVGTYGNPAGQNFGFIYAGNSYTTLDPGANDQTWVTGASGNTVVGYTAVSSAVNVSGFIYNRSNSSSQLLNDPLGVNGTYATGISGNNIVGYYVDNNYNKHGFLYNSSTGFTTLDDPLATLGTMQGTQPLAISGNEITGTYVDSNGGNDSFLYNINTQSFTPLDDPSGYYGTFASGISGNNIVGSYDDVGWGAHGFLYNINTQSYTTWDDPLGNGSSVLTGISGNDILGYYTDNDSGNYYGFIQALPSSAVPEPSMLGLFGIGALGLGEYAWRKKKWTA